MVWESFLRQSPSGELPQTIGWLALFSFPIREAVRRS